MDYAQVLGKEFKLTGENSSNIVQLIDEGNTIPFIARYRKELTGSCDDQVLRDFNDRLTYLRNLEKRKGEVAESIVSQEKMTPEILVALDKALTLAVVEDIYRPYKQKKKTRAFVAIEKGLQPLADIILAQEVKSSILSEIASAYISEEKDVPTAEKAVEYAQDIIAEMVSDDANIRQIIREYLLKVACIETVFNEKEMARLETVTQTKKDDLNKFYIYEQYKKYAERIETIPSHRILAINRGENENCLKVTLTHDKEQATAKIREQYIKGASIGRTVMENAIADSYDRLIFPSMEREIRSTLTDKANEQAIKMFEVNLKPLLMQPPLKGSVILGLDPAYRTGCKIAVIDELGNVLATDVVYPTPPQSKIDEAIAKLSILIEKHKVDVISIGNGTASKEAEIFVADLITRVKRKVSYIVVNEAGASVYSASKLGAEEFPEFDVSLRSAVSIARRLADPLAELIKIDVKSIGVGQYQHDMPEKRLTEALGGVVENCVNSVGVELNSASVSLLTHVAGLNQAIAKNIIDYRKENKFKSRKELMDIKKLGAKAFEQCAGFLRIAGAENILDNTAVHPETYPAVKKLIEFTGFTLDDIASGKISELKKVVEQKGVNTVAMEIGVGAPTLLDIIDELLKPGRDIRDSLPKPILRSDLLDISSLKPEMEIIGTVRNVIDFGVFVDIGVHQDGLVHISQITDRYIKHPSEILKVGDIVTVKVLDVDPIKKKISLTMKLDANKSIVGKGIGGGRGDYGQQRNSSQKREPEKEVTGDLNSMLAALKKKFS